MRRWLTVLIVGVLVLGLSACNSTATPKTDPETGEKEEIENKSDLTAQQVFEKATAAVNEQKSMQTSMKLKQSINMPSQEITMDSETEIEGIMVFDPINMHLKMKMDVEGQGTMETEMYVSEEGFYMFDPIAEQWMKYPDEQFEEMMVQMGGQVDPTPNMTMFKDYIEDFSFEQTNDSYLLTLSAEDEKFTELLKGMMLDNMPVGMELTEEDVEIFENMNVHRLHYMFEIDKETFNMTGFTMDMDMTIVIDGEEMYLVQQMESNNDHLNEAEAVPVPAEVKENAINMVQGQ